MKFIKLKSDVLEAFKEWEAMVYNCFGVRIKYFHTDGGGEYCGTEFEKVLMDLGIVHKTTAPYTLEHNGVAEQKNRSLLSAARCMMYHSGLELRFWAEAIHYAYDIYNVGPTKAVKGTTPFETLFKTKLSMDCFRVFRCRALVLIQNHNTKLASRTKELIYLGLGYKTSGYKLYNPVSKKVVHNRNMHFFESMAPLRPSTPQIPFRNPFLVLASLVNDVVLPTAVLALPAANNQLKATPVAEILVQQAPAALPAPTT